MMYMYTVTYPIGSIPALKETLIENMKVPLPENVRVDGWYTAIAGDGVESHVIYDIQGDPEDALKDLGKRIASYGSVEGFKATHDVVLPIEAVLSM